jgi:23S rRNA (cytosine1962-C5)-methyltransferase
MLFVEREVKRGKKNNGIILDPPAYGHGTDGRKWKLEEQINRNDAPGAKASGRRLFPGPHTYSLGFSSLIIDNLLKSQKNLDTGELYLQSRSGLSCRLECLAGCHGDADMPGPAL